MQCIYSLWYKSFCLCCDNILTQMESRSQIDIKAKTDCVYCTKLPSPEKFLNSNVTHSDLLNILPENNSLEFSVLLWTIKGRKTVSCYQQLMLPSKTPSKPKWSKEKIDSRVLHYRRNQRELHLFGCPCQMENVHFLETLCSLAWEQAAHQEANDTGFSWMI